MWIESIKPVFQPGFGVQTIRTRSNSSLFVNVGTLTFKSSSTEEIWAVITQAQDSNMVAMCYPHLFKLDCVFRSMISYSNQIFLLTNSYKCFKTCTSTVSVQFLFYSSQKNTQNRTTITRLYGWSSFFVVPCYKKHTWVHPYIDSYSHTKTHNFD